MIRVLKIIFLIITILLPLIASAQEDVAISQYLHNQYTLNPAFAGSRNCLSIFGAFRKQWVGVSNAPSKEILSFNSPMQNDKVALGFMILNDKVAVYQNTKVTASYTYRIKVGKKSNLAFGVDGGVKLNSANWQSISTIQDNDPLFQTNGSATNIALGAGIAWYGQKFFTSFAVPSLLYYSPSILGKADFQPLKINYLLSAGYLFSATNEIALQPSALIIYNSGNKPILDLGATAIYASTIWATLAYRSVGEVVMIAAIQPLTTLRIGYSFDFGIGNLAKFGSGSHEISIQYDFGYTIKSSNPKFF